MQSIVDNRLVLGIETSGRSGSVAIMSLGSSLPMTDSIDLSPDFGSARTLAPAIKQLLDKHSLSVQNIQCLAAISGPGSFTGLRVGVATAKAFCYASRAALVEIDAMDVIAVQAIASIRDMELNQDRFYTVMDAFRGQVFVALFELTNGAENARRVQETQIVDIDSLLELENPDRAQRSSRPAFFVGPGCERLTRYLNQSARFRPDMFVCINKANLVPHATTVAKLGRRKLLEGQTIDPFLIMPRYYRNSAAEEKRAAT